MNKKVTIVVDSTCDIDIRVAKEVGIRYMPVLIDINGQQYKDGYEITCKEFYEKLANKNSEPPHLNFLRNYRWGFRRKLTPSSLHFSSPTA